MAPRTDVLAKQTDVKYSKHDIWQSKIDEQYIKHGIH
jgi:hypothetical protein